MERGRKRGEREERLWCSFASERRREMWMRMVKMRDGRLSVTRIALVRDFIVSTCLLIGYTLYTDSISSFLFSSTLTYKPKRQLHNTIKCCKYKTRMV